MARALLPPHVLSLAALAGLSGLGFLVDGRTGAFCVASAVAMALAAWRPGVLVGLALGLCSADLVLTVDVGGFTFRFAQVAAVALLAKAVGQGGVVGVVRFLGGLPGLGFLVALLAWHAGHLALPLPNGGKAVGYLAWAGFDLLVLCPAVAWHVRAQPLRAVAWWMAGVTGAALFGLVQVGMGALGADPPLVAQWVGARPRINAFNYEPSYFAFQALIPAALVAGLLVGGRLGRLAGPAAAVLGVVLVAVGLSTSRSGWLGMAVLGAAGVAVGVVRWRGRAVPGREALRSLAAVVGLAVLAWSVAPPWLWVAEHVMAERALDVQDTGSTRPRLESLEVAWRMAARHPVAGVGPGQFGGALLASPELWERPIPLEMQDADRLVAFNLYLETAVEGGLVGLGLTGAAVVAVVVRAWRRRGRTVAGRMAEAVLWPLLLTFGVMYQFNQTLWRTEVWCLWGVAWALTSRKEKGGEPWRG